jgi:hypothetical protein
MSSSSQRVRYKMVSSKDHRTDDDVIETEVEDIDAIPPTSRIRALFDRRT